MIVGCDGTNVNVGSVKGCIPYLEKLLGRSVEWNICLLHGNELPFHAEFAFYYGKTSGPSFFKGDLGRELQTDLTMRKPVRFARIKNDAFPQLPEEVVCDLSSDQEYLYDICWAIIEGRMDEDFAFHQPGTLCHSRWLTLANRILLAYATTRSPSKALKRLAHIVIEFYALSWFWIKSHAVSKDGPNKYPRVQQMRPRANFRLLNTFKHIYTLLNPFFDFKKNNFFFLNIFILKNS